MATGEGCLTGHSEVSGANPLAVPPADNRESLVRLHLGCGPKHKHWDGFINCDVLPDADVVTDIKKLPFPDEYADEIHAIHLFEHIAFWEVNKVLKEWRRVLKPGGKLVLEMPDMEKCFELFGNQNLKFVNKRTQERIPNHYIALAGIYGDPTEQRPEQRHMWGWWPDSIVPTLDGAGFRNATCMEPKFHHIHRDFRVEAIK